MKLSIRDLKILSALDENSRQPLSSIAKQAGMSPELVRYHLGRMEKAGVIHGYLTIFDSAKLNLTYHKILLRLRNVDERKRQSILMYLREEPRVSWLVEIDGRYDIGIVAAAARVTEIDSFLDRLYQRFHQFIHKHDMSINLIGQYLPRNYLLSRPRAPIHPISYSAEVAARTFDPLDTAIMKRLAIDARTPATQIARETGAALATVLSRLRKLEHEKTIRGYTIALNHESMGQTHHKVLVYLSEFSPSRIQGLLTLCRSINRITYIIKSLGPWNLELDIEAETIAQLREIMMRLTREFSDIIADYDTLLIRKIHKYVLYPIP